VLFSDEGKKQRKGYLSVGGRWLAIVAVKGTHWRVQSIASSMSALYAGGTDMLIRMVRYILAWPDAEVPTSVGACWVRRP